jgi:hypothetical protein
MAHLFGGDMQPVDPVDEWHKAQQPSRLEFFKSESRVREKKQYKTKAVVLAEIPNQMTIFDMLDED